MEKTGRPLSDIFVAGLRQRLSELYGPALERVVLFGSQARGDALEDADYDIAVFLKDMPNRQIEWFRLADLRLAVLDAGGPFLDLVPFNASEYGQDTPLLREIRAAGVTL